MSKEKLLITSALPYVNNSPHLGNIIGCVLSADAYARFSRLRGKDVLYVCGTDEYGSATELAAKKENTTPSELCQRNFQKHKKVYEKFKISFDVFGRTSNSETHKSLTKEIFLSIKTTHPELLTLSKVKQFKCEKCSIPLADRFVKGICYFCDSPDSKGDQCDTCGNLIEALLLKSPCCSLCSTSPIIYETDHYFLNLTPIKPKLTSYLSSHLSQNFWSKVAKEVTKNQLKKPFKPRCITRDLSWGIPVPDLPSKVFYVWFDAPIGYISLTKEKLKNWEDFWLNPNTKYVQFMGKDNVPFHSIYFPSCLIATNKNYNLPSVISSTHYLMYENTKFSKSNKIGIFGEDLLNKNIKISMDVWRFYLFRIRPENDDSKFLWKDLQRKNNDELLNNFGNLVNRTIGLSKKYFNLKISFEKDNNGLNEIKSKLKNVYRKYIEEMESVQLLKGIKSCLEFSSVLNGFIHDKKLWSLGKGSEEEKKECSNFLGFIWVNIVVLSKMFRPFVPGISEKVFGFLEEEKEVNELVGKGLEDELKWGEMEFRFKIGVESLVRKLEDEEIEEYKRMFSGEAIEGLKVTK